MRYLVKKMYKRFLEVNSIDIVAQEEKITNTDCYNAIQMGKHYTKEDEI